MQWAGSCVSRRHVIPMLATLAALVVSVAQAQVKAFVDVAVVPMDRERVLAGQTVVVRGDRIIALGPVEQVAVPAGATRIDGTGKFLIPGLADMHVHLRHIPEETDDTVPARDLLFAVVANGVTTVRDMHSGGPGNPMAQIRQDWTLGVRGQVETGALLGPRIYTAGDLGGEFTVAPETVAQEIAALKAAGHQFVKLYAWPAPAYDSIVAAAARVGLRVAGHVPYQVGVARVLEDHWASIEHLTEYMETLLGLSGRWSRTQIGLAFVDGQPLVDTAAWMRPDYRLDSAKVRALAVATERAGVWNCPTLSVATTWFEPMYPEGSASLAVLRRWFAFDLEITKALHDAGAGLLLGSDFGAGSPIVPGFSIHNELAALTRPGGLTPYQALEVGTRKAAEFLGVLDSTGTVAVGKRADLVLLNGNPLEDIRHVAGPAGVMVAGKWLSRRDIDARFDAFPAPNDSTDDGEERETDRFYTGVRQARRQLWTR